MESLEEVAAEMVSCIRFGNKIMIFGVGGNAATASHFAGELAGKYEQYEDPLPVICLNDNMPTITAITNDFGWEHVFSRQIQGLGKKGDVVIAFSISGKGAYLSNALLEAERRGCITVLLGGVSRTFGQMSDWPCKYTVCVGSNDTPRVQEEQLRWVHQLTEMVKKELASA